MANNESCFVDVGYIFLEDCVVSIAPSSFVVPSHEWFDLDLDEETTTDSVDNDTTTVTSCSRCDLLLQAVKDECPERCRIQVLNSSIRFSGFFSDTKPNQTSCSAYCRSRLRKRTDAALLVGLALTCQDHRHIVIEKACILFKQDAMIMKSNIEDDSVALNLRATMYLTISIPQFANTPVGQRSMVPTGINKSNSTKPMPASTQLLLSLICCDWKRFDNLVDAATTPTPIKTSGSTKDAPTLFPTKLSLEEVYIRIRGLSSQLDEETSLVTEDIESTCLLKSLPKEILVSNIAPYLRARSLNSLRNTCWYLHKNLSFVVPGLKLRLFNHQINSLNWMRMRECQHVSENDILSNPKLLHLHRTGGDLHRAVTGGATVALLPRQSCNSSNIIRISQEYGHEISRNDSLTSTRTVARGGLLCDDPGLGKTITVLSLILQTIGLTSTTTSHETMSSAEETLTKNRTDEIFDAYWSETMTADFRRPALFKLYRRIQRTDDGVRLFQAGMIPSDSPSSRSEAEIDPISLLLIGKKIEKDAYKDSFWLFKHDVQRCFQNVWDYFPPDDKMYMVATRLARLFDELLEEYKAGQLSSARKSFSNTKAKPDSLVAALLEKQARLEYINALVPSKSTLLVVPSTLMDHWEHQIRLHIDMNYCSEKAGLIFSFGEGRDSDLQLSRLEQVVKDCAVNNTKSAFVFLDKSTVRPLPPPSFLAMFDIVITTTQRFTNEWKSGSFQDELKRKERESDLSSFDYEIDEEQACPLLKVRWLRMIVDEGHSMGRGKTSSAILFASWIYAERRWAMTGTPTRQTVGDSGISNVSFLMRYLQHDFFSSRRDGDKVWKNLIAKGWKEGFLASFFRLRSLLAFLVVRHTKLDIEELPLPHFQETVLQMSNEEVKAYNSLVWGVQSNLVLTSMKADTSGMQDSVLDPRNFKYAFAFMSSIRVACGCGGTKLTSTIPKKFDEETMSMLRESRLPEFKLKIVHDHMKRATNEQYSSCMICGLQLLALLIMPCGDLVCSECIKIETRACPVCDSSFNIDFFQRLQPGFVLELKSQDDDPSLQSFHHEHDEAVSGLVSPDFNIPELGVVAMQPGAPRKRTRRPNDGHTCLYRPNYTDGKCYLCLEEHGSCVLIKNRSRCPICYRLAKLCPQEESKVTYVIGRLLDLHWRQQTITPYSPLAIDSSFIADEQYATTRKRPLKAIVFSQFRKVLNLVGDRLLGRFGAGCVAEYWGRFRQEELRKFSNDPNCFCMMLGKDGSEGLDLSFVTHIIFLEQAWDKSLQNQTVARAWRMGSKGPVEVETLTSEKTVEELMSKLEQEDEIQNDAIESLDTDADVRNASETGSRDKKYRHAKLHFLLKNISLIREDVPKDVLEKSKSTRKRRVAWKVAEEPAVRFRAGAYEANEAFVNTFLASNPDAGLL